LGTGARINHYGPASTYECQLMRPNIRMQSCHVCKISLLANEEESIYGHDEALRLKLPNWKLIDRNPSVTICLMQTL